MIDTNFKNAYQKHVADLESKLGREKGLREAIGSDFIAVGKLEHHLLRSLGLADDSLVVDVGCGSGRLAVQLAQYERIRYIGFDVVGRLVDYAREISQRPDWKFAETAGTKIPCEDGVADFVCFFSVFTHLLHEDTFRYHREASRVLKKGGRLVYSFLEFELDLHWSIFVDSVDHTRPGQHLNQFLDRGAINAWARHSGFTVESIRSGETHHIPIPEEICFDNGVRQGNLGTFGQSVAVLVKD